jgi:hypothetical protein
VSLELIALILAVASLVLHYVAPRTKNTVDDKALEYVDKAKELLPKATK